MKSKVANQLFAGILAVTLVVAGPIAPLSAQAASTKTVTVTNEKQLKAALKNNKVTKITIKTSKNTTITIPVGKYGKKQLVINAPKATISNKGDIYSIKKHLFRCLQLGFVSSTFQPTFNSTFQSDGISFFLLHGNVCGVVIFSHEDTQGFASFTF